jgi:hypothetical protein
MCYPFSALVTIDAKVYWKTGVNHHDTLWSLFQEGDPQLTERWYTKVEYRPIGLWNYLDASEPKWELIIDEKETPSWWEERHVEATRLAWRAWKEEVYSKIDLNALAHIPEPLEMTPPKITPQIKTLFRVWMRGFCWNIIDEDLRRKVEVALGKEFMCESYFFWSNPLHRKIYARAYAAKRRDSSDRAKRFIQCAGLAIKAYIGACYDVWEGPYPYAAAAELLKLGFVPVYYDKFFRLLGGPEMKILYSVYDPHIID